MKTLTPFDVISQFARMFRGGWMLEWKKRGGDTVRVFTVPSAGTAAGAVSPQLVVKDSTDDYQFPPGITSASWLVGSGSDDVTIVYDWSMYLVAYDEFRRKMTLTSDTTTELECILDALNNFDQVSVSIPDYTIEIYYLEDDELWHDDLWWSWKSDRNATPHLIERTSLFDVKRKLERCTILSFAVGDDDDDIDDDDIDDDIDDDDIDDDDIAIDDEIEDQMWSMTNYEEHRRTLRWLIEHTIFLDYPGLPEDLVDCDLWLPHQAAAAARAAGIYVAEEFGNNFSTVAALGDRTITVFDHTGGGSCKLTRLNWNAYEFQSDCGKCLITHRQALRLVAALLVAGYKPNA